MSTVNVVLKYHDDFNVWALDSELPFDENGIGVWKEAESKFRQQNGTLLVRRLFDGLLGEKLDALITIAKQRSVDGDSGFTERHGERLTRSYAPPAFENYLWVSFIANDNDEKNALNNAVEFIKSFLQFDAIEYAYVRLADVLAAPPPATPVPTNTTQPPSPSHLTPAPNGVGASAVRKAKIPGANGEGQALVDIEFGWFDQHPALLNAQGKSRAIYEQAIGSTFAPDSQWLHGTSVLGLICGKKTVDFRGALQNATGIAPKLERIKLISTWTRDEITRPTATAVVKAAADRLENILNDQQHERLSNQNNRAGRFVLNQSTVILVELQALLPGQRLLYPVEIYPDTFDAIDLVTRAGISVIEPAGNGALGGATDVADLDNLVIDRNAAMPYFSITHRNGRKPCPIKTLRRSSDAQAVKQYAETELAPFKDSGAVMVAAAKNDRPLAARTRQASWSRVADSNFGSRIDCFAQGEDVHTLGYTANDPTGLYVTGFNATSAASAIIAGAALCVQGMAQAKRLAPLSPLDLREALKIGTSSQSPDKDKIGVMPDLLQIAKKHF
jgi:serine protease